MTMNFSWEALGGGMSGKVKLREKETELLFNSFQFASWKGSRKRDGAKGNEREKGRAKGRSTSGRQRECRSGLRRSKGIERRVFQ